MWSGTYRIQLNKDFTFSDLKSQLNYLDKLGVSHLYLSPVFESTPESNHGYDGVHPTQISVERGGAKGLEELMTSLSRQKNLSGVLLDIVPNHMGVHQHNPFWWNILKHGPKSEFWSHFDLYGVKENKNKVFIPCLGKDISSAMKNQEFQIVLTAEEPKLVYFDQTFPLSAESLKYLKSLPPSQNKKRMPSAESPSQFTEAEIAKILSLQHYELGHWKEDLKKINYRRFFDINTLGGLRIDDKKVFNWAHKGVSQLIKRYPQIHGLRIDHIDGLKDPEKYLEDLRVFKKSVWIEKIVGDGEGVLDSWQTEGTTGYEFSVASSRLFVHLPGLFYLQSRYLESVSPKWDLFRTCVYESKKEMMQTSFTAELEKLVQDFRGLRPKFKKFADALVCQSILELTACLKVYRTYGHSQALNQNSFLRDAFKEARARAGVSSIDVFNALETFLLSAGPKSSEKTLQWISRWEQFSGPVMAKGLEDTALYRFTPLISLNSVGGDPDWRGEAQVEYHQFIQARMQSHPHALNTTSTHDTKTSEDVRCRIHALSEFAEEFWSLFLQAQKIYMKGSLTKQALYRALEALLGSYPLVDKADEDYIARVQAYMIKASREAKAETHWHNVNDSFEEEAKNLIIILLNPKDKMQKEFTQKFHELSKKTSLIGAFNSLNLSALKFLSPGIPDIYQGCELWNFSLVDPDNRRPVDYDRRKRLLADLSGSQSRDHLLQDWKSGAVKLFLTQKLLQLRQKNVEFFAKADYQPLKVTGADSREVLAFKRTWKNQSVIAVLPRHYGPRATVFEDLDFSSMAARWNFEVSQIGIKKWKNLIEPARKVREADNISPTDSGKWPLLILHRNLKI